MIQYKYKINFDIFGYTLNVIYTDNIEESRANLSHKIGRISPSLNKYTDGLFSYHADEPESYIFFVPKSSIGTIGHEASHALWEMFRYYGCELEDETFAYHLGYVIDKCIYFKNKIDKKKLLK